MNNLKYIFFLSIIFALIFSYKVKGFHYIDNDEVKSDSIIKAQALIIPDDLWVQRAIASEDDNTSEYYWHVYSDKNNNYTFKDMSLSTKYKSIDFLDDYYAIEASESSVRIAKPKDKRLIPEECDYIDYGWIPKKDLILGIRSELSSDLRIPRKVMLVNSLESFKQFASDPEELKIIRFYNDPDLKNGSERIAKLNEVYYIYKTSEHSYLLGKRRLIAQPEIIRQNIIGWVNKNRVVPWENNLGIEPNWNNKAIEERTNNKKTAKVLNNIDNAEKYLNTGASEEYSEEIWSEYRINNKRIDGDKPRFPVFSRENKNILEVGVIENLGFLQIDEVRSIWPKDSTINLIFVIDGTYSMNNYFKKVVEAIAIVSDQAKRIYNQKVRFGAVVYTDLHVDNHPLTIESPITSDYKEIESFLNSIKQVSDDEKDQDLGEAVNYGIKRAINYYDVKPWQSNIIILLGDCGNHLRRDRTQTFNEDIINLLYKKDYYLYVFQVHRKSDFNYSNFTELSKTILSGLAMVLHHNNLWLF